MKNLFIVLGMVTLSACGAVKTATTEDAVEASEDLGADLGLDGKWLSVCTDMSGSGVAYVKIYQEIEVGYSEAVVYFYGTSATCAGEPTMMNFDFEATDSLAFLFKAVEVLNPTGKPSGYITYKFQDYSDPSVDRYTMLYHADASTTLYSPMNSLNVTAPGESWAEWLSAESDMFDAFGADHIAGMLFNKVDSAP